jgi:hypothetical protein
MRVHSYHRALIFSVVLILSGTYFVPLSLTQTVDQHNNHRAEIWSGHILFAPMDSTTTYFINSTGAVNHTWSSSYVPYLSVYMLNDGTLLRTIEVNTERAAHGGVERYTGDGTVIWHYEYYSPNEYQTHHDIKPLPNGNVLMIASETKTRAEAIAAGRNPNHLQGNTLMPDYIVEVEPTGPTSGNIVWEWHVWDHLIQDYDSSKENYGVVADHPELIDINFGVSDEDWLHCNSVDYNQQLDQILISFRNLNEIWIIDHSTTTAEASGHSGGNSGCGGDILYRWGNAQSYRAESANNQKLFGQHDASWIKPGYPGEGHILVFNNGVGRGYSSVDEIVPPVDGSGYYYLEPGYAYGPENPTWSYTATPPTSFYADFISGAQRLLDGNTLICDGPAGRFFEVTPEGTTLWQYVNPYPSPWLHRVFKIQYIPPQEQPPAVPDLDCTGSLSWTNVQPGETVTGSFQVRNIGDPGSLLNWAINVSSLNWGTWSFHPEVGENLTPEDGPVVVQVSVVAPNQKNSEFTGAIRVENRDNSTDFAVIPVDLKTPTSTPQNAPVFRFLQNYFCYLLFLKMVHNILR